MYKDEKPQRLQRIIYVRFQTVGSIYSFPIRISPKTQQYSNIKITNKNYILKTCNPKLTELIFKPVLKCT